MEKSNALLLQLQEILNTKNFHSLEGFRDPEQWGNMKTKEKELLGQLFILKGEACLPKDNKAAKELFHGATLLAGNNARLFFLLGKAYASQEHNVECLNLAFESFSRSTKLAPSNFEFWYAAIETLILKGEISNEVECFIEARTLCQGVYELATTQSNAAKARFYWLWGKCSYSIGKRYGETVDFYGALEKYRSAIDNGIDDPDFWKQMGDIHYELAHLVEREDLYHSALEYYQKALQFSHDFFEAWLGMGLCYFFLFQNHPTMEYFSLANSSFEKASKLNPSDVRLWTKWAQLQFDQSKQHSDLTMLEECILKFEKANVISPSTPILICHWGEAQMLLGAASERIELLKEAERKFSACLEIQPDDDNIWHLFGCSIHEMGRYFADEAYFRLAIEKFQYGLSINRRSATLWHDMAVSYFALAESRGDASLIEKATQCCSKAIECGGENQLQCLNDWGIALMKLAEMNGEQSHIEAAIEKFETAIELQRAWEIEGDPDLDLLYNYGCACDCLGEFTGEISWYEKSIQLLSHVLHVDHTHIHARYNLALTLSHLGDLAMDVECFVKSIEQFEQLLAFDPEDEMAWMEYGVTLLTLAVTIHDPIVPQKSLFYFQDAEHKLMQAAALGCSQAYYSLACFHSLTHNPSVAMFYMEKARLANGLPSIEDLEYDEWLEPIRHTEEFYAFIAKLRSKESH